MAQTISFEISLALIVICVSIVSMRLSFYKRISFAFSLVLLSPLVSVLFFIILLIETNRTPFDFAEGERELVSGFNIEFGSVFFVLIFLAEYGSILIFSRISVSVLLGYSLFSIIGAVLSISISFI